MPPGHSNRETKTLIDKRELIRAVCYERFYHFIKYGWRHLFPEEYIDGKHIELLCDVAQTIITGDNSHCGLVEIPTGYDGAIINIPPGHMKSRCFSVSLPAWCFGPRGMIHQWLCGSLAHKLSMRDSDACRDIIKRPWFQEHWPIAFKGSQDAKTCWSLDGGAKRDTTSTGAKTTGLRADIQLLDDPQNLNSSMVEIESANHWIQNNWSSRSNFGSTPPKDFLIQQRVGDNDATARALELDPDKYLHIWLPVEFDPDNACPYDWRTKRGELLWPEAYSKMVASGDPYEWVEKKKRQMGPINWDTQFQQRPHVIGGQEFQLEWLQNRFSRLLVDDVDRWIVSLDASFKGTETSDWCVMGLVAKVGAYYYLVDVLRRKMAYPELRQTTQDYVDDWKRRGVPVDTVVIEDKANGPALIAELHKHVSGLVPFSPKDSKLVRYRAVSGIFAAGQFFLPDSGAVLVRPDGRSINLSPESWREQFVSELITVPNGKHDDQADMVAQAILYLESFTDPEPIDSMGAPEIDVYTVERRRRF